MQPKVNKFTTTLRKIASFDPCSEGWEQLTTALGTTAPDAEVSLAFILNSNGINDAIWALRCFDYKDYCLFTEDVAESVAHLNPDPRVSAAIAAVRAWHKGQISEEELRDAADAARAAADDAYTAADAADAAAYAAADAADAAAYAAADAAYAAHAACYAAHAAAAAAAAARAAHAAADAADAAAHDACYAANAACYAVCYAAHAAAAADASQWGKITELFIEHFC